MQSSGAPWARGNAEQATQPAACPDNPWSPSRNWSRAKSPANFAAGAIGQGRDAPQSPIAATIENERGTNVPATSSPTGTNWNGGQQWNAYPQDGSSPPQDSKIFKSYNPSMNVNGETATSHADVRAPNQPGSSPIQNGPAPIVDCPPTRGDVPMAQEGQGANEQVAAFSSPGSSPPVQGTSYPSQAGSPPNGSLPTNHIYSGPIPPPGGPVVPQSALSTNQGEHPAHMAGAMPMQGGHYPPPHPQGGPYHPHMNQGGPYNPMPSHHGGPYYPPLNPEQYSAARTPATYGQGGMLPGQATSFVHVANGGSGPDPLDSRTYTGGRLFPSAGLGASAFGGLSQSDNYSYSRKGGRGTFKTQGGGRQSAFQRSYTAAARSKALTVREFNRRISICARKRDIAGAMAALQELDRSPTLQRNLFTYNAVINSLVMCGQYPRALDFWKEMRAVNIRPNLVTYNTMMKSCFGGKEEDVNRAFALLQEMERDGIEPDQVTFNSLINACVSAGRIHLVEQAYGDMIKRKIYPDDFTFTTLSKAGVAMNDINMLDDLLIHQLKHHTNSRFTPPTTTPRKGRGKHSNELSPVAYNTIADGYIRCGFPDRALELLARLHKPRGLNRPPPNGIPVAPDVQTFNVRLKALRESRAPSVVAFETLEEMKIHNLDPDHITLLTLADLCCRRRDMALAEGVLHVAYESDIQSAQQNPAEWNPYCRREGRNRSIPSRHRFTKKRDNAPSARRNSNQPRSAKCNASLFNSLIRGYTSLNEPDIDAAMALYSHMVSFVEEWGFDWYAPDSVTFTMLVDGYARNGDFHNATKIVEEMERAGRQNVVAYNAYIKSNRANGSDVAISVLERIKAAKLAPDVVTYNTILDFFTTEEHGLERAESLVLNDMPQYNIKPDMHTFNTMIKGAARSGPNGLKTAYKWLKELEENGFTPDEFTYQSMVSASAAAGDAPRALEFFHKCEEERAKRVLAPSHGNSGMNGRNSRGKSSEFNLLPHPAAYIALMRAFLTSHKESGVSKVLSLRDEMLERGLALGRAGHTAVADAFAEIGDFENVDRTLNQMVEEEKDEPTGGRIARVTGLAAVHYSIRMKALCKAGELDHAISLLDEMKRDNVKCDAAVFNVLLSACSKAEDHDRMIFVLRRMEASGITPDASTSRAFVGLMSKVGKTLKSFNEQFRDSILKFATQQHLKVPQKEEEESTEDVEVDAQTK